MPPGPLAPLTEHGERRRDQHDHEELADFDAYIKGEQRPAKRPPRQLHFPEHVREPEAVDEAERERDPRSDVEVKHLVELLDLASSA